MRTSGCWIAGLGAALVLCSCESAPEKHAGVKPAAVEPAAIQPTNVGAMHMARADGNVYLGAQPSRADFASAAVYPGIETVLNLRRESEMGSFDEAALLDEYGVAYQNVPFGGPEQLTDQVLDESIHVIETAQRPLLVHCSSGNRVGAVWMAYRMLEDGYSQERALEEARQAGLSNDAFIPIVTDYVQRRRAQRAGQSPSR